VLHIFYSTDKAWFHFRGYVNSPNVIIWSAENPLAVHRNSKHSFVKDWCLVRSVSKTNCGTSVLRRDTFCEKLSQFLTQFVVLPAENERDCWFQQDGNTARTGKATAFLQEFLGEALSDLNAS
jgi:hypothetical protein